MYDDIERLRSPSRNLISRLSFAAVTRISEILPPALFASDIKDIARLTRGVPTLAANISITSPNATPQDNWSLIILTS